jgi:serine phosphatase RsbU (regulator of sigma subunit)
MKKIVLIILVFILQLVPELLSAQNKIDSLLQVLKTIKPDTNKVNAYNKLGKEYEFIDQKLSRSYLEKSLKLSDSLGFKSGKANAYTYLGYLSEDLSQFDSSKHYYILALDIFQSLGNKSKAAHQLKLIGDSYSEQGDYTFALNYYQKALKIYETINSQDGVASINYSMGNLYQRLEKIDNAMDCFNKSLSVNKKLNRPIDIANDLTAIGMVYNLKRDYKTARKYYFDAKKIYEELNYDNGLSNCLTWIAITAYNEKDLETSLEYFNKSLDLYKKINNVNGLIYSYNNIGNIYSDMGNYSKAIGWEKKSLEMALKSKGLQYIQYSYQILANSFAKMGDFKNAYIHHTLFTKYKDSLLNEANMKQINEMQTKYETEKKDKELIKKDAEILKQTAVADKQTTQRNYFLLGFALMLAFSIFIFRSYSQKKKANKTIASQKEEVEKQKDLVELKQKEIVDSITYAQRLQQAILPPLNFVRQYLPESFILYKPKDIVAGDFYWMHVEEKDKNSRLLYIAAADCTGHGVPGALVSVVCSNALDRAVKEFKITDPGQILDKVRELVVETFEKSESEVKDGMDISLCRINTGNYEIHWSGANNPLWYIESGTMKEIKANKQPIGKIDAPLPFTTHYLQLNPNDKIYLFTDGYADQFGGEKGKKFKYKHLQQIILSNNNKNLNEQKEILNTTIEEWKGGLEQVDDVLVMGICI